MSNDYSWVQTFSGMKVHPLNPRPEEISLTDIAWSLSMQPRFSGHILRFYSVAEHCVHIFDRCSEPNKKAGLFHDASEAYLSDMMRPIKQQMPEYQQIESRLMEAIAERFSFVWPLDPEIKAVDQKMLFTERDEILPTSDLVWEAEQKGYGEGVIQCWSQLEAYYQFIDRCNRLSITE